MGYRYIALIGRTGGCGENMLAVEAVLRKAGMQRRTKAGPVELFSSEETPVLTGADGTVLIGHLFSRHGAVPIDRSRFPSISCDAELRKHLLENFWGEYLLFQPSAEDEHGFCITRDPSGGVGCIYSSLRDESGFIASDISLATSTGLYQRRIDWDYITCCLTFPYQTSMRTGLTGINELPPGCTLRLTGTDLSIEKSWSPWDFVATDRRYVDAGEAATNVGRAVVSAVRAWANLDRSILLEISGGLDSSIVAACLRGTQARLTCCTLVTPVPGADERHYARQIARQLGVDLQTETLDFESARINFKPISSTVSPRVGALQYAINNVMSSVGNNEDVASFFGGAGGDTVFCYLTNSAPAADAFKERGLAAGFSAIRDLSALHQCTLWTAAWLTLKKMRQAPKAPRTPHSTFVNPSKVSDAPDTHPWFDAPTNAWPGDRERIFGLVDTLAYREMASRGTERWQRMPLLAQPVVEACLKTPSWMWIAGGRNRAIARIAFADMLPADVLNRRSKGNFLSYLGGVYRRSRSDIRDFLLSGHLHGRNLLNTAELNRFFGQEDLPMRDGMFLEIFDLCMIENWVRHQN